MAVVKTTGPNRTAQHRLQTRKLLSPCRTSSNERSEGGSDVWRQYFLGGKITLRRLTSLLPRPHSSQSLLNSSTAHKRNPSVCKIWIIHMEHFTELRGKWWLHLRGQNDTATLPPSGIKNGCPACLYASYSWLSSATLLAVELKANLQSVAQLDVQP